MSRVTCGCWRDRSRRCLLRSFRGKWCWNEAAVSFAGEDKEPVCIDTFRIKSGHRYTTIINKLFSLYESDFCSEPYLWDKVWSKKTNSIPAETRTSNNKKYVVLHRVMLARNMNPFCFSRLEYFWGFLNVEWEGPPQKHWDDSFEGFITINSWVHLHLKKEKKILQPLLF